MTNHSSSSSVWEAIRRSPFTLFGCMIVLLVVKEVLWHVQMFADLDIRLHHLLFTATWLSVWMLLGKRRPWWTLLVFVASGAWLYANYAYYKVWHQFITLDDVRNVGNLAGFGGSAFSDWNPQILLWLILPDVLYLGVLCWSKPSGERYVRTALCLMLAGVLCTPLRQLEYFHTHKEDIREDGLKPTMALLDAYHEPRWEAAKMFVTILAPDWDARYVHHHGVVDYAMAAIVFDMRYNSLRRRLERHEVSLTPEQEAIMEERYHPNAQFTPKRNLILILVESFETWAIDAATSDGRYFMPYLREFLATQPTFFAPHVDTGVRAGKSSDGQLMLLTGLAPISRGFTVTLCGDQPFPNYAHFYPSQCALNPSPGTWRKEQVFPRYGVQTLEGSDSIRMDDAGLFHRLNAIYDGSFTQSPTPQDSVSLTVVLTISSHVPFSKAEEVDFPVDEDMPEKMARYLKCMHYVDQHMGTFLSRIATDSVLRHSDIVITGDHSILYGRDMDDVRTYADSHQLPMANFIDDMVPLIIYSPTITEPQTYTEMAHQIDVYPTILHAIGCTTPTWEGVGMDLLSTEAQLHGDSARTVGYEEAYQLSNFLIRNNYFGTKQ